MKKFLGFALMLLPLTGFSWGVLGHRIVGEVAESHLSSKARSKVKQLLGNESLAMSSNWADFIKSDSAYNYISSWHYDNFPAGLTQNEFYKYLAADTTDGAYRAFKSLKSELKKKDLPHQKQVMYLKLLIHIVGDMHQPLHMGRKEDLGGNRIRVMWFNDNVNLHQVWDERLVNFQQLSYTEYEKAINHTTPAQRKQWGNAPVEEWLHESYECAQKIYAGVSPEQKLSYRYNFDHITMLNEQLLKGGVRLAAVLNEIYGSR
ncbi:MAG: S1/P1 Nuclease [Chitinophagaceae bacterium]|nr:MAG: S1/P1 Nuclease [Chitinophagaceae bacterium]